MIRKYFNTLTTRKYLNTSPHEKYLHSRGQKTESLCLENTDTNGSWWVFSDGCDAEDVGTLVSQRKLFQSILVGDQTKNISGIENQEQLEEKIVFWVAIVTMRAASNICGKNLLCFYSRQKWFDWMQRHVMCQGVGTLEKYWVPSSQFCTLLSWCTLWGPTFNNNFYQCLDQGFMLWSTYFYCLKLNTVFDFIVVGWLDNCKGLS